MMMAFDHQDLPAGDSIDSSLADKWLGSELTKEELSGRSIAKVNEECRVLSKCVSTVISAPTKLCTAFYIDVSAGTVCRKYFVDLVKPAEFGAAPESQLSHTS